MSRLPVGFACARGVVTEVLPDNYYVVECRCGNKTNVWHANVLRGKGCRRCSHHKTRPRQDANGVPLKEYVAWSAMVARIHQTMPSWSERYRDTAYNGMQLEEEWVGPFGFDKFMEHIGERPVTDTKLYLDRINNELGYVKGNVRWATASTSNINKRNASLTTAFGETKSEAEWCGELGVTQGTISKRINILGWTPEEAVSTPSTQNRPTNDAYYLRMAGVVALRGNCARRQVGCVLVDENFYVLATAYNSVPSGMAHCTTSPCAGALEKSGEGLHKCISEHAETLALIKCADVHKIHTLYCTDSPCEMCLRKLISTSCKRIVFANEYPHPQSKVLWESLGREWVDFSDLQ